MRIPCPNAMIFAAGKGTRMGDLTRTTPKPLLHVAGRPLIDYALDIVAEAGAPLSIVNLHTHADQLRHHLAARPNVQTIYEPTLLETGGGLRAALPVLGEGPVLTLNSDAIWTGAAVLDPLLTHWNQNLMGALLLLVPTDRAVAHHGTGDFALQPDGQITRGGPMIYTGAQMIDPSGLHKIPQDAFSLTLYWRMLAEQGRLFGVVHPGAWADAGTPDGLAAATSLWEGRDV